MLNHDAEHCDWRDHLNNFDFDTLFIEALGWDRYAADLELPINGQDYHLRGFAEKRGVQVFECRAATAAKMPDFKTQRKIETQLRRTAREHLVIYSDATKTKQVWKPVEYRGHEFYPQHQSGDSLIEKLQAIQIPLDEEESLDLLGAVHKLRDAFDRDKLTKKFYDLFQKEQKAFLAFIDGIREEGDREWYASLMLNRLMFVYFIQKKGFLDRDTNYLLNRLNAVQDRKGKGKFHTFYRYFLLSLFHQGFAKQPDQRELDADLKKLLGDVPYLNGGLFDVHELEQHNPKIEIADEAFERIFAFFEQFEWTLDTRPLRDDKEINPDVLGYIFEKYINQKQMGAYYTKEDITDYISRNTIIPYLFDEARKKCAVAFQTGSALWRLLQDTPDRYIYPAVRRGVIDDNGEVIPIPATIERGIKDVTKRECWNRPAAPEFALPTETWREYVARRERCLDMRKRLAEGSIFQINDLITYNLDIRRFAEDAILSSEGPELLRAFYQAITGITVLDPTCGSGAFLFAALNILEPLYEACLDRMRTFVEELASSPNRSSPEKYKDFRAVLEEVSRHPNAAYFVLKSIVVKNLYGVDIMEEAVEICKLRLFLKLVSQVDNARQLEPLPDIDFNIRPGNTLVGFATLDDVNRTIMGKLTDDDLKAQVNRIIEDAEIVDRAFQQFHEMQTKHGMDAREFASQKQELRSRLDSLSDQLDRYLAGEYSIDPDKPKQFQQWQASHQPFHWCAEFFAIMREGGFNVLIGNPPWIEYAKVKNNYTVKNYRTEPCGNLHGICTERGLRIRSPLGYMSFIVQLPLLSSSRMASVRRVLNESSDCLYVMPFGDRPGKLFDGLEHSRATIWMSSRHKKLNGEHRLFATSRYQRWPTVVRPFLFHSLEYACINGTSDIPLHPDQFPKCANQLAVRAFQRMKERDDHTIDDLVSKRESRTFVFYQEATEYWVKATIGLPYYAKNGKVGAPAHGRYLYFPNEDAARWTCALLHSSLFFVYFIAHSDCFHLNDSLVRAFPVPKSLIGDKTLTDSGSALMDALRSSAERKKIQTKAGDTIAYDEYYGWKAKPIMDRIDAELARHYCFTDDELDFIINYDIKYRMGQDGGEEE